MVHEFQACYCQKLLINHQIAGCYFLWFARNFITEREFVFCLFLFCFVFFLAKIFNINDLKLNAVFLILFRNISMIFT